MANVLYTPEQAARSTLAALRYNSVLGRTVNQSFSAEFVAGRGQTVNVVGPVTLADARTYTKANRDARAAIVFDELGQATFPVTLEDQIYSAVRLPDDFATFTLTNLEQQVLRPQAEKVAKGIHARLVTQMAGVATDAGIPAIAADGSNVLAVLIAARRVLNSREVPLEGRTLAVGAGVEAAVLGLPQLQKANESGDGGDMLRQARIGNLFGFEIIAATELPENYGVAYNRDAFTLVTRPSRPPQGAGFSSTVAQDGFALRWIQHYNPLQLEDQSVVDCFAGATTLDAERAVSLTLAAAV